MTAITSAVRQAEALPYREVIRKSIWRFAIDNYVFAFEHYLTDFDLPISEIFYNHMRNYMLSNEFDSLSESDLYNQRLYHMFKVIRMRDYKRMQELHAPRLICSLTTFPARINGITSVLNSVYNQTLQPDLLILWLAEDQFPEKEQE